MPDPDRDQLRVATPQEVVEGLSFALRFRGRKRVHQADTFMVQITAERLVEHLMHSGFVLMKTPPAPPPRLPTQNHRT
jgi:hypothetical protein